MKNFNSKLPWKDYELSYLRGYWKRMTYSEIAGRLGRTPNAVFKMARKLGFRKINERS